MSFHPVGSADNKANGVVEREDVTAYRQSVWARKYGDYAARIDAEIARISEANEDVLDVGVDAVSQFFSKMHNAGVSAVVAASIVDKTLERDIEYAKVQQAELAVAAMESQSVVSSVSAVTTVSSRSSRRAIRKAVFLQKCDDMADENGYSYLNLVHRARRLDVAQSYGAHPGLDAFLSIPSKDFDWEAVKKCTFVIEGNKVQVKHGMGGGAFETIQRTLGCYSLKGSSLRSVIGQLPPGNDQILPYYSTVGEIFLSDRDVRSALEVDDVYCGPRLDRPVTMLGDARDLAEAKKGPKLKLDVGKNPVMEIPDQIEIRVEKQEFLRDDSVPLVSLCPGVKHIVGRQRVDWKTGSQVVRVPAVEFKTGHDERVVISLEPGRYIEYGGTYTGSLDTSVHIAVPSNTQVWLFDPHDATAERSTVEVVTLCRVGLQSAWDDKAIWPTRFSGTSEERFSANATVLVQSLPVLSGLDETQAFLGRHDWVTDPFDVFAAFRDYRVTFDVQEGVVMRPAYPVGAPVCRADKVLTKSGEDAWLSFQGLVTLVDEFASVAWKVAECDSLFSVMGYCSDTLSYHVTALADTYTFDCVTASTDGVGFRY